MLRAAGKIFITLLFAKQGLKHAVTMPTLATCTGVSGTAHSGKPRGPDSSCYLSLYITLHALLQCLNRFE